MARRLDKMACLKHLDTVLSCSVLYAKPEQPDPDGAKYVSISEYTGTESMTGEVGTFTRIKIPSKEQQ